MQGGGKEGLLGQSTLVQNSSLEVEGLGGEDCGVTRSGDEQIIGNEQIFRWTVAFKIDEVDGVVAPPGDEGVEEKGGEGGGGEGGGLDGEGLVVEKRIP